MGFEEIRDGGSLGEEPGVDLYPSNQGVLVDEMEAMKGKNQGVYR
jgi:hypothetical protein